MDDTQTTTEKLLALLESEQAKFKHVQHQSAGKSEEVAKIRGTQVGQGAKALVCQYKTQQGRHYLLAVLAADRQADLAALASQFDAKKVSLASPVEVDRLTACVFGAIPPFSFHPELKLIADPELFERFDEIAFNAGELSSSIVMDAKDYLRIAQPEMIDFIKKDALV